MQTLKQLRTNIGASQGEVSAKLGVSVSTLSLWESGAASPCLEDMIVLERQFGTRIDWQEPLNNSDKEKIVEGLAELLYRYPVQTVLTFAAKSIKEGQRLGEPASMIQHYAGVAIRTGELGKSEIGSLYPPEVTK